MNRDLRALALALIILFIIPANPFGSHTSGGTFGPDQPARSDCWKITDPCSQLETK